MARTTKFDKEEAVKTVMFSIWQHGYANTSVKSLSELLGITRSSFYNAFESREALFKRVLDYYVEYTPLKPLLFAKKGEAVCPILTSCLKELCSMRAKDSAHKGCLAMNSVAELCSQDTDISCHMSQQLEISNSRIEQLLIWAQEQNEISKHADIQALALAVTNLFVGLNIMSKAIHQEERLWKAAKTTLVGLGLYAK